MYTVTISIYNCLICKILKIFGDTKFPSFLYSKTMLDFSILCSCVCCFFHFKNIIILSIKCLTEQRRDFGFGVSCLLLLLFRPFPTVCYNPYQRDQLLTRAAGPALCSALVFCTTNRLWLTHSFSRPLLHFIPQVSL